MDGTTTEDHLPSSVLLPGPEVDEVCRTHWALTEKLSIYLLQPKWVSKIGNFVRIWKITPVCQNVLYFCWFIVPIQLIFQTSNDSIRFLDEYYPFVPTRTQGLNLTPGQMTMIIKSSWSPFDLFFFLERLAHDEAISWCKISWEASAARFPRFDAMSDGWFMGNDDRNSNRRPPRRCCWAAQKTNSRFLQINFLYIYK